MTEPERYFVIPTHRLRDVGDTIHEYDEHFWRNGHSPQIIIFDDSTPANEEKYLPLVEQNAYSIGAVLRWSPRKKEEFISYLNSPPAQINGWSPLVKNIFRPSYGGNRKLLSDVLPRAGLMVSSDDDMRPLLPDGGEVLSRWDDDEISRGRLHKVG